MNFAPPVLSADALHGKQLVRDIYSSAGVLLLSAHTILNVGHLRLLNAHRVALTKDDVQTPVSRRPFGGHRQAIDTVVLRLERMFLDIHLTHKIPITDIRRDIVPVLFQVTEQPNVYRLFASIQAKDDSMFRHQIGVGVVATLIGKWLRLGAKDVLQLATAAVLHDVGKMRLPLAVLQREERLTDEEKRLLSRHTIWGYEMIRATVGMSHRQALVALQHHERLDGSGYPLAMHGGQIDLFSRIVAVADVFVTMTSARVHRAPLPFCEALHAMRDGSFGALDPHIVHLFFHRIMHSLVGNEVSLTDGRRGVVVMANPYSAIDPLVRLDDSFLDLSRERSVHIARVLA